MSGSALPSCPFAVASRQSSANTSSHQQVLAKANRSPLFVPLPSRAESTPSSEERSLAGNRMLHTCRGGGARWQGGCAEEPGESAPAADNGDSAFSTGFMSSVPGTETMSGAPLSFAAHAASSMPKSGPYSPRGEYHPRVRDHCSPPPVNWLLPRRLHIVSESCFLLAAGRSFECPRRRTCPVLDLRQLSRACTVVPVVPMVSWPAQTVTQVSVVKEAYSVEARQ